MPEKKILLVEDDSFILDIYSKHLEREGYKVEMANDGEMALEKVKNSIPDLILLDLGLPGIDGWEVLKRLRENPATQNVKVVIISNNNQDGQDNLLEQLKVIKYFVKIETTAEEIAAFVKQAIA